MIHENEVSGDAGLAAAEPAPRQAVPRQAGGSVLLAVQRAAHRTLTGLMADLADLDLTASEVNVLANLANHQGPSVGQLSRSTGTKATTLTGVLDRLERRGYLTRQLDQEDRRSFRITLTPAGEAVAARIEQAVAGVDHRATARCTPAQLSAFHAVIDALGDPDARS